MYSGRVFFAVSFLFSSFHILYRLLAVFLILIGNPSNMFASMRRFYLWVEIERISL